MPFVIAVFVAILALAQASAAEPGQPPPSPGSTPPARGPLVLVPDCTIVDNSCGLDPNTPDLNRAACAATFGRLLERRGLKVELPGPVKNVCASDPNVLVTEVTINAICPVDPNDRTPRRHMLHTELVAEAVMRDCASGEIVGRGESQRSIETGRHGVLQDVMEEFAHHVSVRKVRASHPETPRVWLRTDVGREHSLEVSPGVVDIGGNDVNEFLTDAGLTESEYVSHTSLVFGYNPWIMQKLRFDSGVDYFQMHRVGDGFFDPDLLNMNPDPNKNPSGPASFDVLFRAIGVVGGTSYGWDITRHQRISGRAGFGWYFMGTRLAKSHVFVEGTDNNRTRIREKTWGVSGDLRWDWRVTTHVGLTASFGWNRLNFRSADIRGRDRFFPYDIDFTGPSYKAGVSARF